MAQIMVKAQRFLAEKRRHSPKLMIYSQDGKTLPPTIFHLDCDVAKALGNRRTGYFLCDYEDQQLTVIREIEAGW